MPAPPRVSVVLPVHNGGQFLAAALDSLQAQTEADFEIIVINDGSTDDTAEVLRQYERWDPRLVVRNQTRSGIIRSLNVALGLARGDLVARMDADDLASPDRFERQIAFLDRHPPVGLVGGSVHVIDASGSRIGFLRFPISDGDIRDALAYTTPFCHPATMMRRSVLQAAGGYRRAFRWTGGDYDLWLRLAERCVMANLDVPVLHYRWHSAQMSAQALEPQLLEVLGARQSAELRRSGQRDVLNEVDEVTLELLEGLGQTAAYVQSQFLSEVATRAAVLVSFGRQYEAASLLDSTVKDLDPRKLTHRARARADVAYARAYFGLAQPKKGFAYLARGMAEDPVFVLQAAGRGGRDIILPKLRGRLQTSEIVAVP